MAEGAEAVGEVVCVSFLARLAARMIVGLSQNRLSLGELLAMLVKQHLRWLPREPTYVSSDITQAIHAIFIKDV